MELPPKPLSCGRLWLAHDGCCDNQGPEHLPVCARHLQVLRGRGWMRPVAEIALCLAVLLLPLVADAFIWPALPQYHEVFSNQPTYMPTNIEPLLLKKGMGRRVTTGNNMRMMLSAPYKANPRPEPLNCQFPDLMASAKLNTHALINVPSHYSSVLYLSLDRNQDFAVWPAGYETLSRVASLSKTNVQVLHCPMNVSHLSFELADRIITTLDHMEGPTLVVSASGRRASAVRCIYMSLCGGLTAAQTIQLAQAAKAPFLESPALKEWVAAVIARHSLTHHLALHQVKTDSTDVRQSFVVGCCEIMEGVMIDPKDDSIPVAHKDLMGLELRYTFNTKTGKARAVQTTVSSDFIQLKDGDHINFGNNRFLEVRQVNGPRGRRYCLIADDRSMAFSGDLITSLRDPAEPLPIMKDEHEALELYDSIASCLLNLPRETMLFHSSGPTTTVAAEKSSNRLLGQSRRVFAHRILESGAGLKPRWRATATTSS